MACSSLEKLQTLKSQLRFLLDSANNAIGVKTAADVRQLLLIQNKNLGKLVKLLVDILLNAANPIPPILTELKDIIDQGKNFIE